MADFLAALCVLFFSLWQSERMQRIADKNDWELAKRSNEVDKEARDRDREVDRRERQALTAMLLQETNRRQALQLKLKDVLEDRRATLLIGDGAINGGQREGYIVGYKFVAPKVNRKKS